MEYYTESFFKHMKKAHENWLENELETLRSYIIEKSKIENNDNQSWDSLAEEKQIIYLRNFRNAFIYGLYYPSDGAFKVCTFIKVKRLQKILPGVKIKYDGFYKKINGDIFMQYKYHNTRYFHVKNKRSNIDFIFKMNKNLTSTMKKYRDHQEYILRLYFNGDTVLRYAYKPSVKIPTFLDWFDWPEDQEDIDFLFNTHKNINRIKN